MKLIDRIAAATRFVFTGAPARVPVARYEGAQYSPNRTLIPGGVLGAKTDIDRFTRAELVRKSRYFEKNNAIYNRLADLFEQYTVGRGIPFFPASALNEDWNEPAMAYWQAWQPFADLSSRQTWGTLQGIIARALFVDGEIFILKTRGDTNNPRIQLIESHRVKDPNDGKADSGNVIVDGVEIDQRGRPVAYWIESDAMPAGFGGISSPIQPQGVMSRVPAEFVVHVWEPGRAGQVRGIPYCHAVINDLHDLDDLQVFEMQAAKHAASVTNVIKTKSGEVSDEDLVRGTATGSDGVDRASYYKDVFGAETKVLKNGDEFGQFKIERPSAATSGYWDYLTAKICAGVGIPKEIVVPTSMQGTSMRSVIEIANGFFRTRSAAIAEAFRQVYEFVIVTGIQTDATLQPAPADWYLSTWQSPRSISVDIGYDSKAAINEFRAGMRTLKDFYGERGEDWRCALRQRAIEAAEAEELAQEFKIPRATILLLDPNELSAAAKQGTATPAAPVAPGTDPADPKNDPPDARLRAFA